MLDDMNGFRELDKNQVIGARRLEMDYFRKWVSIEKLKEKRHETWESTL